MIEFLTVYLCIGAAIAALMALGAARMEVGIELLGRPISPVFPIACTLVGALLAWPLVIWLLVRGRKAKSDKAEPLNQAVNAMAYSNAAANQQAGSLANSNSANAGLDQAGFTRLRE